MKADMIIRNGSVVLLNEVKRCDIAIKDGRILEISDQNIYAAQEIDAEGLYVMPGMIDAHVHLNEPGLDDWEGFINGSSALAAGGCTTYIDMPLNGVPPTIREDALDQKLASAIHHSYIDFALWGGLVPGNLDHLEGLSERGVIGFKAFMSSPASTGEDEFREVDDYTLYEGMKRIAKLGKILALHAESDSITGGIAKRIQQEGKTSALDYAASRPVIAELEAVNRALFLAEQTGCSLHFVHLSSAAALDMVHQAKLKGMDVTTETCPHYLALNEQDFLAIGAAAKCSPPIRSAEEQEELWEALKKGRINIIASDHSPCPTEMKSNHEDNLFKAWGGISGAQHSLPIMIHYGYVQRGIGLPVLAKLLSYEPARRFGFKEKGEIRIGADADLVLVNIGDGFSIKKEDLFSKHKHSPYVGLTLQCSVVMTINRGNIVYSHEEGIMGSARGRWIQANLI